MNKCRLIDIGGCGSEDWQLLTFIDNPNDGINPESLNAKEYRKIIFGMEKVSMMRRLICEKTIQLLKESDTLSLSIVDEDGYPKIYPMEKVLSVDLNKIIFITKKDSNKVSLLNISNKCCVEVHTEDDMVCLKGNMEIQESEEKKREILPQDYIKRLEASGSNKYCILIFRTFNAELYIEGNLESIPIE